MIERQKSGVILNIGLDYGIIGSDQNQRIYRKEGVSAYWGGKGIRVSTFCPASLNNGQNQEFICKISELILMGRMSDPEEYMCMILYMIADARSGMNGATVVLDSRRTII